jgi:hypothetical protein
VACVFVKANVNYSIEYVTNLRAMVAKHLRRPYEFVCLTDRAWMMPEGIRGVHIQHDKRIPGWWAKANLFDPKQDLGDRVLYLDLDTLIVASLEPIVDYPSTFALVPHAGAFQPKTKHKIVRRFNSSVMVWDVGVPPVFQDVSRLADVYWGDQDVIGEYAPWAETMPSSWFPRLSDIQHREPDRDAKVVLVKKPKTHIAADLYPWVNEAWRAA